MMTEMTEKDHPFGGLPEPIWHDSPRHRPEIPLPETAYVPGGDRGARANVVELVRQASPGSDRDYHLYGIDLYHRGYLWEAHEAWEWLWQPLDRHSIEAKFYQGLILNAAAQLKVREGRIGGVRRLSTNAYRRIQSVRALSSDGVFLGMDIARLEEEMARHYGALWNAREGAELQGAAPHLVVSAAW